VSDNDRPEDDQLDVEGMLARFRDRAEAVRQRPLPPVAGTERQRFVEQAQLDFQDYAIIGDARWTFEDGVLTLTIDLRPSDS
jgi:hypothetical protein